jgi:hypothetical protein
MSNGEKLYKAMKKSAAKSIEDEWHPDWYDFAGPIHQAFIEDCEEDFRIKIEWEFHDENTGKLLPEAEVMLQGYVMDNDNCPYLGKAFALSDLLIRLFKNNDEEECEIILERSISKFREKFPEQNK